MGKNRRNKALNSGKNKKQKPISKLSKPSGITKSSSKPSSTTTTKPSKTPQVFHKAPSIPFSPDDHILLVGEGDLSFARCLIEHYGCTNLTATVLEKEQNLKEKYPHVEDNIGIVEAGHGRVRYGVDATTMKAVRTGKKGEEVGCVDRIFFNFPHVGGKSTDVNRQVRYNQEMLVAFFARAIPSLSPRKGSSIIVTLFEGEPYTLWNIRDLARHAGLAVAESYKFQVSAYPGYKHARTLGVVKGGGGWKGEDRPARSYVFVRKGEGVVMGEGKKKKAESSDDESEDEEMEEEEDIVPEELKSAVEDQDHSDIYETESERD